MPEVKDLEKKFLAQVSEETKKKWVKSKLKEYRQIHQKKYELLLFMLAVFFGLGAGLFSSASANLFPNSLYIQIIVGLGIVAFCWYQLSAKFWHPRTKRQRQIEKEVEKLTGQIIRRDI
ncbi:MAG: hypothetical protein ABIE23_05445 [archaeon]